MRYLLLILFSIFGFAQQPQNIDFKSVLGKISLNPTKQQITGHVVYEFNIMNKIDSVKIDAQNMIFEDVLVNNKNVDYENNNKKLIVFQNLNIGKNILSFSYKAVPKQALYFNFFDDNWQIWTQGQGKYTSYWFPSFDDVNEKVIFNLDILFDKDYQVISNGIMKSKTTINNQNRWQFRMQKPMSSYLLMLAIGKYDSKTIYSKSGIPLQLFIEPEDKLKFESTYRHSKELFDNLEDLIGIKYPWQIYKQIPIRDFLYAGMENTTATTFSREFVVDSTAFIDKNYIDVNAHELSHQWFGDLVTAKSGKHHWLQEGFATYYSLLAQKSIFGNDFFQYQMYEIALELNQANKNDTIPILNEKASSLTFYKKGAWALHILRENVGEKIFKKIIKSYLNKYKFKNVETDDFLAEVQKYSKFDTQQFKKSWLENSKFNSDEVYKILSKNKSVDELINFRIKDKTIPYLKTILESSTNLELKKLAIYELKNFEFKDSKPLFEFALKSDDLKIRKAIAETLKTIPLDFLSNYESFLSDKSYETNQIAFTNLWKQFPENRKKYLDIISKISGYNNFALRISWLTFGYLTKDYQPENNQLFIEELESYTSNKFESSARQNAIEMLLIIQPNNEIGLKNLVNATTNIKWQFVKYAKTKIRNLLKKPEFRIKFEQLKNDLSEKEQLVLTKLLNEL